MARTFQSETNTKFSTSLLNKIAFRENFQLTTYCPIEGPTLFLYKYRGTTEQEYTSYI